MEQKKIDMNEIRRDSIESTILDMLDEEAPLSSRGIGERLGRCRKGITTVLNNLEKKGKIVFVGHGKGGTSRLYVLAGDEDLGDSITEFLCANEVVYRLLKRKAKPLTIEEISQATNLNFQVSKSALSTLKKKGKAKAGYRCNLKKIKEWVLI